MRHLVVGLGNPGRRYRRTRHNVGFRVAEALAAGAGAGLDRGDATVRWTRASLGERPVLIAEPLCYMNRSGPPVRRLMEDWGIGREDLLVIHDDVDLALGRFKFKEKGGDGGHRGVRSLIDALGDGGFGRLRIGIGRPADGTDVVDHVLGDFTPQECAVLDPIIERACRAAVTALAEGIGAAMNRFNTREPLI